MGLTIWLGSELGEWLDNKYNKDFLQKVVVLFSIFIAIYMVIAQVIKVSKEYD